MSLKNGQLLWNRRHVLIQPGANLINTFLTQQNLGLEDPPIGIQQATPPADGSLPASRVQVIPLPPLVFWSDITIGEPYYDTDTGTVQVEIRNGTKGSFTINVLFLDPGTVIGPGQADPYNDSD